jgi:hypothetical protein
MQLEALDDPATVAGCSHGLRDAGAADELQVGLRRTPFSR